MVLELRTGIHRPNFDYTVNTMNQIGQVKGIPVSMEKLKTLRERSIEREKELSDKLLDIFKDKLEIDNVSVIDFTSRTRHRGHIVLLICKYYNLNPAQFEFQTKTSLEYRFTKETQETLKQNLKKDGCDVSILEMVEEVKDIKYLLGSVKQFVESLAEFNRRGGKMIDGIFYMYPKFDTGNTMRIVSSKPNIQGKGQTVKELITAPEGYKIVSMDISGQEVHILLWGIMTNKEVWRNYTELGDPYYALLKTLNMPLTKEYRDMAKVPVLGLMNGMSRATLIDQINDVELVDKMMTLIEKDAGFQRTVTEYAEANLKVPKKYRKGLFGSTNLIPRWEEGNSFELRNKLRNGFFQLTAAEITAMSIQSFYRDIYKFDKTLNKLRLLTPIYDEFVFMVRDDALEESKSIIERNMKPIVNNWSRFTGELKIGQGYIG